MSQKYTDARYPEKINDLIDNEGTLSEEGKAIINENVKEAIEGGDIPIPMPTSGTKWYKHHLTVKYTGQMGSGYEIDLISTYDKPITAKAFDANKGNYIKINGIEYPAFVIKPSVFIINFDQPTISSGLWYVATRGNTSYYQPAQLKTNLETGIVLLDVDYSAAKEITQFTDTVTEL